MSDIAAPSKAQERGPLLDILSQLARDRLGLVGLIIVLLIVLSAIFADWIVPYDPVAINVVDRL